MPSIKIPRITKEFIRDGFKNFDHFTLYKPEVVLNFHYPDVVLFTLLAHIKKPKHILDLGSYFGMLPFLVEEIARVGDCPERFEWTLVDNCLYTKELADAILTVSKLSNRWLNESHLVQWHNGQTRKMKREKLFNVVGEWSIPPHNTEQFNNYWQNFSELYEVPKPNMVMLESVDNIGDKKFDLVHFDLTAGSYNLCIEMLHLLLSKHLQKDAIIVFDDLTPRHPMMLLFFQYMLKETCLRPIAFSTGKIAMMDFNYKSTFLQQAYEADLIDPDHSKRHWFSFLPEGVVNGWGTHLNLRAN
jgi:hypothetical protein